MFNNFNNWTPDITKEILVNGIIAAIAGVASSFSQRKKTIYDWSAQIIISFFTGSLTGLIAMQFFNSPFIITGISGTFGFMGEKGMYFIISAAKRAIIAWININDTEEKVDKK